jgi:protein-S-isoprenylcysteine O-methyltransferase Ste14
MNTDNPGVKIPPPLIYAAVFIISVLIQKKLPVDDSFFKHPSVHWISILFFMVAIFFSFRSLTQFFRTKNSIIPIKAASSLQTTGIYHKTRNPMYLSLLLIYLGLTCIIGNWWCLILLPLLLLIIQQYVIKREEQYLTRRFGQEYIDYTQSVRRWL